MELSLPNTIVSSLIFYSFFLALLTTGSAGRLDQVLSRDGLSVYIRENPLSNYRLLTETLLKEHKSKRVKRSHFVGRRSYGADPFDLDENTESFIPDDFILAVRLGVPVGELNLTSLDRLKAAFAHSDKLNLPVENVGIDKIRFQGNRVEMFFIKSGHNTDVFGVKDLIQIEDIFSPELLDEVKTKVPELNITSIIEANYVVVAREEQPVWKKTFFPYVIAGCGIVLIFTVGILVYWCCCRRKAINQYGIENIVSQHICVYPSHKPSVKQAAMIQPPTEAHKGCITPSPSHPVRVKAKGLLERRGSNASLTIDLTPSPEFVRWDGTPPKESSGLEFLLSAGNRLSCKDLRNSLKNSKALYEEFWGIPMNLPEKVQVAGSGMKNRYKSIIPNEHSRVILPDCEQDPLSSYINANMLRGYEGEMGAYIATQGPMSHTMVDFWRMVWNEKVPIIVMITKLREKNKIKCENYLPEVRGEFGEVEVTIDLTTLRQGYLLRHLTLRVGSEFRSVLHYWYTDWPDHKPPDSPKTLLDMVKDVEVARVLALSQLDKGPVLVHCSAGIGRTGCFVAISVGMRQVKEEHSVDILGIVCSLRIDRGGMIQTGEQYEFIHHALCLYEKELNDCRQSAD